MAGKAISCIRLSPISQHSHLRSTGSNKEVVAVSKGRRRPNPKAAIPVLLEDCGQLDWITWGSVTNNLATALLSTVQAGGWAEYHPGRGFGMVQRFM